MIDITELSNAYVLCTCSAVCTRACLICSSVTWEKGPCVKQLWVWHGNAEAEHAATQRFRNSMSVPVADIPPLRESLSDEEKRVEQMIDWMEDNGIPLQPWQAMAFRAIMLEQGKRRIIVNTPWGQ
jgi:hypothetical protein